MLGRCIELIEKYNIAKVYIDGSNPSFIRSLKQMLGERSDYEKVIEYYKKIKWHWKEHMQVIPVNFSTEHREMLGHAKMLMEEGKVAINPIFDKLVVALRTAVENEGSLYSLVINLTNNRSPPYGHAYSINYGYEKSYF